MPLWNSRTILSKRLRAAMMATSEVPSLSLVRSAMAPHVLPALLWRQYDHLAVLFPSAGDLDLTERPGRRRFILVR